MEARRDAEDAQAEQYNHLTSDMLTENPDCAVSALGSPHVVAMAYRGMSDEERAAIRKEQQRQAQARKVGAMAACVQLLSVHSQSNALEQCPE